MSGVPVFCFGQCWPSTHYRAGTMLSPLHPCSDPHGKPLADASVFPFSNEETEAQEGLTWGRSAGRGLNQDLNPDQAAAALSNQQALSMKVAPLFQIKARFQLSRQERARLRLLGTDWSQGLSLFLVCSSPRSACLAPSPLLSFCVVVTSFRKPSLTTSTPNLSSYFLFWSALQVKWSFLIYCLSPQLDVNSMKAVFLFFPVGLGLTHSK